MKQFIPADKDTDSTEDETEDTTNPEAVEYLKKNQGMPSSIFNKLFL